MGTNLMSLVNRTGGGYLKMGYGSTMLKEQPSTPTAASYIQNGLIGMWDGIENAGWGTHDASATTWKDLIGNVDAALTGVVIDDKSLYFRSSIGAANVAFPLNFGNIEVVAKIPQEGAANTYSVVMIGDVYSGWGVCTSLVDNRAYLSDSYDSGVGPKIGDFYDSIVTLSMNKLPSGASSSAYKNGIAAPLESGAGSRYADNGLGIGKISSSMGRQTNMYIYSVRIYSRNLTESEVIHNRNIDVARFGVS